MMNFLSVGEGVDLIGLVTGIVVIYVIMRLCFHAYFAAKRSYTRSIVVDAIKARNQALQQK